MEKKTIVVVGATGGQGEGSFGRSWATRPAALPCAR